MRDYFDDMIVLQNFSVEKAEVKAQDYTAINNYLELLQERGKDGRGSLILTFAYDDEKEEIFEIPEIREYVCQLLILHPSLFYYLVPIREISLAIAFCLMGMKLVMKFGNQMQLEPVDYNIFRKIETEIIQKTLDFGKKIGDENGARKSLEGLGLPIKLWNKEEK